MIKILMCSHPGGNRGPGNAYYNHLSAVKNSKYFEIDTISNDHLSNYNLLNSYDVFWFSVRFHPQLYLLIKQNFPNKKIIMGPNVLFEKPESGPSDEWENWFCNNVNSDFYFNKADFYVNYAKKYFKNSKKYKVLPNCITIDNTQKNNDTKREKVLVYAKKRRIDNQFDKLFPNFINSLEKEKIKYDVIEYGKYKKEDLLKIAGNYLACFWFSIEDYCSNAQLEIQSCGTPIIGTPYNTTHVFDKSFLVDGSNFNNWITWKDNISELYIEKFKEKKHFFQNKENFKKVSNYINKFHSYEYYVEYLYEVLKNG